MRKILLIALAATLILGATPALAGLYGVWEGKGAGNCCPQPGITIYPWQQWKGSVYDSPDEDVILFTGNWNDGAGNTGIFKGKVQYSPIPELATAKGSWYWYDPSGSADPLYGGDFKMNFWYLDARCDGNWTTIWPSTGVVGTMKGYWVSPD
jgi:hypothetical protein